MAKDKNKPGEPEPANKEIGAMLFGGEMTMLPKELAELGLSDQIAVEEIPGVAPSWKPVHPGDMMIGRCVDMREMELPDTFHQGQNRKSTVLVFNTAIPGGFRSVWIGAELKIKMRDPVDKVYTIYYDGTTPMAGGRQPMKTYRVYLINPLTKELPPATPPVG
jgi:hypothetical protein